MQEHYLLNGKLNATKSLINLKSNSYIRLILSLNPTNPLCFQPQKMLLNCISHRKSLHKGGREGKHFYYWISIKPESGEAEQQRGEESAKGKTRRTAHRPSALGPGSTELSQDPSPRKTASVNGQLTESVLQQIYPAMSWVLAMSSLASILEWERYWHRSGQPGHGTE